MDAAERALDELEELEAGDDFERLPEDVIDLLKGPLDDLLDGIEVLRREQAELPQLRSQFKDLAQADAAANAKGGLIPGWHRSIAEIIDWRSREQLAEAKARGATLQGQLTTLNSQEPTLRQSEQTAAAEHKAASEALKATQDRKRDLEESARLRAQEAKGFRDQAKAALTGVAKIFLPVTDEVVTTAQARLAQLEGAVDRLAYLHRSESELVGLRGEAKELERQVEATHEGHRVAVEVASQALADAQEVADLALSQAKAGRRHADERARARKERLKTQAEVDERALDRAVWERVGQLLGRGGIQTVLMRSALEDIQERANTLLNRISGGQLQLQITCEQNSRGEEIYFRCLDAASAEQPLEVEFLSGGQRFRCAVALAAGIGQRAGAEGNMPSQIIDEGFGSLDVQGRLEMLDEVRQMSEFYERVIVVSHMESFHDEALFPARFELRKDGARTVVTTVG